MADAGTDRHEWSEACPRIFRRYASHHLDSAVEESANESRGIAGCVPVRIRQTPNCGSATPGLTLVRRYRYRNAHVRSVVLARASCEAPVPVRGPKRNRGITRCNSIARHPGAQKTCRICTSERRGYFSSNLRDKCKTTLDRIPLWGCQCTFVGQRRHRHHRHNPGTECPKTKSRDTS